jgi:hypothetical protein
VRRVLLARVGLAVQRLDAHAPHQRAHVPAADLDALQAQQVAQHAAARERVLQVQLVDAAHQRQLGLGDRLGVVVHRAPADAQQLGLPLDRQFGFTVDHRFALSNPALVSAPSKKSFSSVSCPILACSALRSTGGSLGRHRAAEHAGGALHQLPRHSVTWLGCTSCFCAISAIVLPSAKASNATLALNAAEWLRRGLLLMLSAPSTRALSSPIGAAVPL